MAYEIEKRCMLTRAGYDRLKSYLDKNARFAYSKRLYSYLFREPSYLRIRLIEGDGYAHITEKSGTYYDTARFEKNTDIKISQLKGFIAKVSGRGYKRCVPVLTHRRSYLLDRLVVELNEISHIGLILEIEALTNNKQDIKKHEKRIMLMMKKLRVKELHPSRYQKMLDKMYGRYLTDIKKIDFKKISKDI